MAKSIEQLQDLQKEALRSAAPGPASSGEVSPSKVEQPKPGTSELLGSGEELPLLFGKWPQVASCIFGDVSDTSAEWWGLVRHSVDHAERQWMQADPLNKALILPDESLCGVSRWSRLNSRVASMLLSVVSAALKVDLIARQEVGSSARILFRLFLLYQPAGSGEKEVVLKRLHSTTPAKSALEAQQVLRNWARWEARAREIGLVLPDPSILARALTSVLSPIMSANQDLAFKLNVARQALRLDQNPSLERVLTYHRHALAEIDSLVTNQGAGQGPQLRPLNTPIPTPKSSTKPPCKYFLSDKGCKKAKCGYLHDMSSLDKAARSRKCLKCGSEAHRRSVATVRDKRGDGTDQGSPASASSHQRR